MRDRAIFVTGAASGIGRATAQLFAGRGWRVGLFDVDEEGLARTAREVGGERAFAGRLDVADRASWAAAVDTFGEAAEGRMDALVQCAGIHTFGWFEDVPEEASRRVVEVNLLGVLSGIYACLPLLRGTPGSRVVSVASMTAFYGFPLAAVYSATKGALRSLTEALNVEMERHGIFVCDVLPSFIDTPLLDKPDLSCSGVDPRRQTVYPVRMAAEGVWRAVHGRRVHTTVGADAACLGILAGLSTEAARGLVAWRLRQDLRRGTKP